MKRFIFSVLSATALFRAADAQTDFPPDEADKVMMVITNMHLAKVSMAYGSTTAQRMLGEANYFSERLRLPTPHPIQIPDIAKVHVSPPLFSMDEELGQLMKDNVTAKPVVAKIRSAKIEAGGFIETTNFVFSFHKGCLWDVINRVKHIERFDLYAEWAKTPSLIDTNGAYQLAAQWLSTVGIDVGALEKAYQPKVEQQWCWNQPGLNVYHPPGDTNKTMLPIYDVTWGTNWNSAKVQILGTTKELMELRIDSSFSRRPPLVITNAIELNNIPDPPIAHLQRLSVAQTNLASPTKTNAPSSRPPPFQLQIK